MAQLFERREYFSRVRAATQRAHRDVIGQHCTVTAEFEDITITSRLSRARELRSRVLDSASHAKRVSARVQRDQRSRLETDGALAFFADARHRPARLVHLHRAVATAKAAVALHEPRRRFLFARHARYERARLVAARDVWAVQPGLVLPVFALMRAVAARAHLVPYLMMTIFLVIVDGIALAEALLPACTTPGARC